MKFIYILIGIFILVAVAYSIFNGLPHLPKDSIFVKENVTIQFPIMTSLLIAAGIVFFLRIINKI